MYVRFERIRRPNSFNDTRITDLSWMMTESMIHNPELAPDLLPNQNEDFGNLNSRNNDPIGLVGQDHIYIGPDNLPRILLNNQNNYHHHYQQQQQQQYHNHDNEKLDPLDGWLAVATVRGIIGISYTTIDLNHIRSFQEVQALPPVPPPPPPPLITNFNRQMNIEENDNLYIFHNHTVPSQPNFNSIPARTNFNLRGHRADLIFVRWNEQYQKLASCDRNGVIFVWIKYEGRWSIELINDRNTRVTDFSWSHDGRMALICYMDGFVLVGSVSGQRYWSSTLNLNDGNITCGGWSIDNQHVLFGTSNGHILVITVHGVFITQVSVQEGIEVSGLTWSYKRPYLPENETKNEMLAVSFVDGTIFLMKNYDEIFPIVIETSLINVKMEWSNKGEILAVGGHRLKKSPITGNFYHQNIVRFYSKNGSLIKQVNLDYTLQPLSALTWACNDRRLFIACGQILYTAWILCGAPSLTFFAGLQLYYNIKKEVKISQLNVPVPVKNVLSELFSSTIHCYLPDYDNIGPFVFRPPANNLRLHCTLIRQGDVHNVNTDVTYTLYLEYMGGFVPILKGKRSSKIKPEFVIFNPQRLTGRIKSSKNSAISDDKKGCKNFNSTSTSRNITSDSDNDDNTSATNSSTSIFGPYLTPKTRRRLRFRANQLGRLRRANIEQFMQSQFRNNNNNNTSQDNSDQYHNHHNQLYDHNNNQYNQYHNHNYDEYQALNGLDTQLDVDELPENDRIVLITSNIWGTKFKFIGLTPKLPTYLGSVTYRTSLLHLQPRQMSLVIKELNESNTLIHNHDQMKDCPDEMSLDNMSTSTWFGIKSSTTPVTSTAYYSSDSEDEYSMDQYQHIIDNNMMATIAPMQSFQSIRNSMLMENNVVPPPQPPMPPVQPVPVQPQEPQPELPDQPNEQLPEQELAPEPNPEPFEPLVVHNEVLVDVVPQQQSSTINDNSQQQNQMESNEIESPSNNEHSIRFNYSNILTDEFLTLQIQQNDYGGSSYNLEIKPSCSSTSQNPNSQINKSTQSSTIDNQPLELIDSPLSPQWNQQFSTSTMVQQFKHQTFHSESPKHVAGCYNRTVQQKTPSNLNQSSSTSSSSSSKMYSMSSSKQKSPRKSSVSYCSNEFGNSKKSYMVLDNKMATTSVVCDIDNGDTATTSTSSLPMATTYIYNDLINKTTSPKSQKTTGETVTTTAAIEMNPERSEEKIAKSNIDDIDSTEEYFRNVEQIVQTMSERLAKNQRETASESKELTINKNDNRVDKDDYSERFKQNQFLLRSNSLPSNNISPTSSCSLLSSIDNYHQPIDRTIKKKCYNSQNNHSDDIDSVTVMETVDDTTITCKRAEKNKKCQNQSLPASPLVKHRLDNFKFKANSLTGLKFPKIKFNNNNNNNNKNENENSGGGKHFFQSPKMVRKIKQKLSYLDCSTDDDNDDNEFHTSDDDGDDETSQLEDPSYIHVESYRYHRHNQTSRYQKQSVESNLIEDNEPGSSKGNINKINFLKGLKQSKNKSLANDLTKVKQTKKRNHRKDLDDKNSKRFLLHNKAPLWNEVSQVYQLDFGGRVTQESAKNFQIEFQGRQVMQFGRIDSNAYTLDFEYPFSAVQAMAVALANVTQRLK